MLDIYMSDILNHIKLSFTLNLFILTNT